MTRAIPILLYHRVGHLDGSFMDKYTVSPRTFSDQMHAIRRFGWRPIALEEVLAIPDAPDRSLILTFDDGFASNRQYAWPVLERHAFPAATFVVTDCLGSYNHWDGPSRASYPLLSADDIAAANPKFMSFHSHSATHPDLTFMSADSDTLKRELENSRQRVSELGTAGNLFAYPRGSWNWAVMKRVRHSGYSGACTCMEGLNSARTNPFLLRRIEICECDVGWRFWLKIRLGRDLLQWPPKRLPMISICSAWLRRNRKVQGRTVVSNAQPD